jgi:hypothetical protein
MRGRGSLGSKYPWVLRTEKAFEYYDSARHYGNETTVRKKGRRLLSWFRGRARNLGTDDNMKAMAPTAAEPRPVFDTNVPGTLTAVNNLEAQCSFFGKLPAEIRIQIYTAVLTEYPSTIHILAGEENGHPSRTMFHLPCIKSQDLQIHGYWLSDEFRWEPGPWGSNHLDCDWYSSKVSASQKWKWYHQDHAGALLQLLTTKRTPFDIPDRVITGIADRIPYRAPFIPLLLACRRMLVCS